MDDYTKKLLEKAEAEAERRAWLTEYFTRNGRELDEVARVVIEAHVEDEEAFRRLQEDDTRPKECSTKHLYTLTPVDPYRHVELTGPRQVIEGMAERTAQGREDTAEPNKTEVRGNKGGRPLCDRTELLSLLESFEESGLNQADYARRHDMVPQTLSYRLKKARNIQKTSKKPPE